MILSLLASNGKHYSSRRLDVDDSLKLKRRHATLYSNENEKDNDNDLTGSVSMWTSWQRVSNVLPSVCITFLLMGSSSSPGNCYPAMDSTLLATAVVTTTTDQLHLLSSLSASRASDDAARLLLDPPPSVIPSKQAIKELQQQRALQDFRLSMCQETGSNFDQCFFYGTKNTKIGAEFAPSMTPNKSQQQQQQQELQSLQPGRSKIPTW